MQCYCNSGKVFDECCKLIISGNKIAATAQQLMRSRYSAYVIADVAYLMNSHHPATRPLKERKNIGQWAKSVSWLGLEIIATQKGTVADHEGFVEFKALYMENGQIECIHENSYFVKENNRWFYKSGIHT